jgi:pyruvate kinase
MRPGNQWAILLDTKGPEIRTGNLKDHQSVTFQKGQTLEIVTDYSMEGDNTKISCSYKDLPTTVKPGDQILIADGSLVWVVKECYEDAVTVTVVNNGTIGERKNMNLPGVKVNLPTLTEQDEKDIVDFGLKHGIDIIAASFVRKASDIEYIRDVLGIRGAYIKIVAKIENQEGLENFDEIMHAADGIMVARGDLGMELPTEKVFLAQEYMIQKWNMFSKPVIVATQMLESMINNPRPTRAEASDVANAVLQGTDCVMLSGETANGNFPVGAVTIMAKIASEAENIINYEKLWHNLVTYSPTPVRTSELLAASCAEAALSLNIDLIILMTITGRMARLVSKYRPQQPILACSTSNHVVRQMNLMRGVIGYKVPSFQGAKSWMMTIIKAAKSMNLWKEGNTVITLRANKEEAKRYNIKNSRISEDELLYSNMMEIIEIE